MTSSEIRCKQVRVNFSKTTKLHELVGRVQIAVLKNLQTLSCIKLHPKFCHYLLIINMKKINTENQGRRNFLPSCYNFTLVLHEECTRFQLIRSA